MTKRRAVTVEKRPSLTVIKSECVNLKIDDESLNIDSNGEQELDNTFKLNSPDRVGDQDLAEDADGIQDKNWKR